MDALVELTNKVTRRPANVEYPPPDYDINEESLDYNGNGYLRRVDNVNGDDSFLTAAYIKKMIPNEMKNINKDIQYKSKQDMLKRPEFLAKQHQMKTNALKKQEAREKEENNELFSKLKSRSDKIDQAEKKDETNQHVPEFMKVKLKKKAEES